jgi:MFS family permease
VSDLSRNNRLMMLALFLWASGEGLFVFIQPLYIQQLGATPGQIGGVLSLAGLGMMLTFLPGGLLADRAPRKLVLLGGWVLGIAGALAIALATDWRGVIPGIVLYSLSAFCVPAISATIADAADGAPLARVITLTYAGYWAGNIASPWIGGWLAALTNMRVVYVTAAVCFALSTVAMLMISTRPRPAQARALSMPSVSSLRFGLRLGLVVLGIFLAMYLGVPLTPNFLSNTAGWPIERIGLLGSLNALGVTFLSPVLGRLSSDATRRRRGLWIAQASVWMSFALVLLGARGWPGLVYLGLLLRSGFGACRSLTNAIFADQVAEENRGVAFGLAESSVASAQMIAPFVAGQLYGMFPAAPIWAGLILIPASMALSPLLSNVAKRTAQVQPPALPESA